MAAAMQQAQEATAAGLQVQVIPFPHKECQEEMKTLSNLDSIISQEEEEQFGPLLVATLEQHGIASADVKKLMVGCFCGIVVKKLFLIQSQC